MRVCYESNIRNKQKKTISSDEMYHHGILGQRWGKRNGPPYPLGSSDHSASENKAGWRKSLDKSDNSEDTESTKKGLTDKQKKYIKIGAAAAVTAVAAVGVYQLYKHGVLDGLVNKGAEVVGSIPGKESSFNIENQQSGTKIIQGFVVKTLGKAESFAESALNANPNRGDPSYKNNCTACSIATFFRNTLGWDVTAKSTGGVGRKLYDLVDNCFQFENREKDLIQTLGKSSFTESVDSAKKFLIKRYGKNASGVCSVIWAKTAADGTRSGHAFNWSIINGAVTFFDGKGNYVGDAYAEKVWNRLYKTGICTIARLDNAEPILEKIQEYVQF